MASIKFMLNKARQLNDGTYPLVVQILHRRKKRVIYLDIYLYLDEFDEQTEQIIVQLNTRRFRELKNKQNELLESIVRLRRIRENLEQKKKPYTTDTIVGLYHMGDNNSSMVQFWQTKISKLRVLYKFGIANAHQNTLRSIIKFAGTEYIGIGNITAKFIHDYEIFLQERGVSKNTVCFYMRNFKTIMNIAINEGLCDQNITDLFDKIKTAPRKTLKRAINREGLQTLSKLEFEGEPLLELSRDLFMFSFYARGMAFVDIAFLRKENLSGTVLSYSRRKTGQVLKMSVNKPMSDLIKRYSNASHYLFPVVSSENIETAYSEYRTSLRRINKGLKIIGVRLNFETSLTTYVARHSWATQAKQHGYPLSVISEGLGHRSENITQIYLKEFDHSILDSANEVITNL